MKQHKTRIISITIALLLIAFCIYQFKNSRFVYNDEHADGNTAGNLLNNGLFCEYEGTIYFSNLNDDGKLYSMNADFSNIKKLSNDKVSHINTAGEHIIYSRINNKKASTTTNRALQGNLVGIYRCSLDGSDVSALDTAAEGIVHQYGNNVFFQNYTDENIYSFSKVDIEGKKEEVLNRLPISPASIVNGTLYYAGLNNDMNLHTMKLDTLEDSVLLKGKYHNVTSTEDSLYMMDVSAKYTIIKTDLKGQNKKELVSSRTSTFNVTKDQTHLYYQVDDNEANGIYRMNLATGKAELLLAGNYSNINITEDYVFFTDLKQTTMYAVRIGDHEMVQQFNPPVKK